MTDLQSVLRQKVASKFPNQVDYEGIMAVRLRENFNDEIVPAMMERFGYSNKYQVPRLEKISLNMGIGEAVQNPKAIDGALSDLTMITGQRPSVRKAKKSVSNFKLREGVPIGCAVTLRSDRMYEFLDRFFMFAVPRIRDFRGLSPNSFDGRGNYTVGIKEQIVFPEIHYDQIDEVRGMDITIVTTANTDEEAYELLRLFGMPFRTTEAA
jgi:large subunit ribosomal protein L5